MAVCDVFAVAVSMNNAHLVYLVVSLNNPTFCFRQLLSYSRDVRELHSDQVAMHDKDAEEVV